MEKYKVLRNTYPRYPNVAYAEPGDIVYWGADRKKPAIIRVSDRKVVFRPPVDGEGFLTCPLSGIIAQVKSRGWLLEIEEIKEEVEDAN